MYQKLRTTDPNLKYKVYSYPVRHRAIKTQRRRLVTNVTDLSLLEVVARDKGLADIERGFRVLKDGIEIGPIYRKPFVVGTS